MFEWLSARLTEEENVFLNRTVTGDETWVHHCTPEFKQATTRWRNKDETAPVKGKTRLSAEKVLATVML